MTLQLAAARWCRRVLAGYPELVAVLSAAALGLGWPAPARWVVDHGGINTLLVVLVFATAVTITVSDIHGIGAMRARLALVMVVATAALPALSWLVAQVVSDHQLRRGVLTIGVAPCEIASVATVAMAGGLAAPAAALLIGSTVVSVIVAGPILELETGSSSVHPATIAVSLALIVLLPMVVGIVAGARTSIGRHEVAARRTTTTAVAALVALIASQVQLSRAYFGVIAASLLFVAGSAGVGVVVASAAHREVRTAIVLTTSMRDFAIAAGIAASAFGAASAAPLGLYGIVVLVWGTTAAGRLRRTSVSSPAARLAAP